MDCLVVGCGLSGAVIARYLAEQRNKKVTIWERRNHIGGNMYDFVDEHGILVHKYGPHTFHTNKKELYDFICRYANWEEYKLTCMAKMNGKFTPTPFNFKTIDDYYTVEDANILKMHIKKAFGERKTATVVDVLENHDELVRGYAQFLFDNDYSPYTAKQWGVSPSEIDPSVLKRVPLRFSYDTGYFDDKYQIMPQKSYEAFFEKLLDHSNITVELNTESLDRIQLSDDKKINIDNKSVNFPVVYTGALDELFGLTEGKLPYRSLRFEWKYEDKESFQDAPVVAYPQEKDFTRITEYKKLPVQNVKGTSYAVEYPRHYQSGTKQEPYYPVLTENSQLQYIKYKKMADSIENLYYCGRLADFKYYNMDQALERAIALCDTISFV